MLPHDRPELIPSEDESNEFEVVLECREKEGLWPCDGTWKTFFRNFESFFDAAMVVIWAERAKFYNAVIGNQLCPRSSGICSSLFVFNRKLEILVVVVEASQRKAL
jgi:hypothetical protein